MSHHTRGRPSLGTSGLFWWENDSIAPWWSNSTDAWNQHRMAAAHQAAMPPMPPPPSVAPDVAARISVTLSGIGAWRP